jgi:hypothetical protein
MTMARRGIKNNSGFYTVINPEKLKIECKSFHVFLDPCILFLEIIYTFVPGEGDFTWFKRINVYYTTIDTPTVERSSIFGETWYVYISCTYPS